MLSPWRWRMQAVRFFRARVKGHVLSSVFGTRGLNYSRRAYVLYLSLAPTSGVQVCG